MEKTHRPNTNRHARLGRVCGGSLVRLYPFGASPQHMERRALLLFGRLVCRCASAWPRLGAGTDTGRPRFGPTKTVLPPVLGHRPRQPHRPTPVQHTGRTNRLHPIQNRPVNTIEVLYLHLLHDGLKQRHQASGTAQI